MARELDLVSALESATGAADAMRRLYNEALSARMRVSNAEAARDNWRGKYMGAMRELREAREEIARLRRKATPCDLCDNGDGHLKHKCPRQAAPPAITSNEGGSV